LVVAGSGWDSTYGEEVRTLIDEENLSIPSTEPRLGEPKAEPQIAPRQTGLSQHRTLPTASSACVHAVDMLAGDAKWGALYGCEAFVLPMDDWMLGSLREFSREELESAKRRLDPKWVDGVAQRFERGELHWTRLWQLVVVGYYIK